VSSMKLSIVVPAYNEEQRLGLMLAAYLPYFASRYECCFELIVVVNGSTDGTAALVRTTAESWPQLRLIEEPAAIGKGGAVMLGLQAATGECAGYVDADGSTPPFAFQDLVEKVDAGHPVAIASRWIAGAQVFPAQPLIRRVASRVFNAVTRGLFGLKLHDTQCGAKVFHRAVLDRFKTRSDMITRWAFDVDLLYKIRREGYAILEVPTTWRDVEGSKLTVTETSLEMLAALVRLRLMYSPFRWIVGIYDRTLTGGKSTDESLRQSLLFGVGGLFTNGFNLAFQIMAAHALLRGAGGSGMAAYGELAVLLGVAGLVSGGFGGVARHFFEQSEDGLGWERGVVRQRMGSLAKQWTWPLVLLTLIVGGAGDAVAGALRLDRVWPVYLVPLLIWLQAGYALFTASLTGMKRYRSLAMLNVLYSMLRFMAAGALLLAGHGLPGLLIGAVSGTGIAAGVAGILTFKMLPSPSEAKDQARLPSPGQYGSYVLPVFGFALLSGMDIVLVKLRCMPVDAGVYALAAMLARMVFFIPMPIAAVAFARFVSRGSGDLQGKRWKELALMGASMLLPLILIGWFAPGMVRLLTGADPLRVAPLLRMLTLAYVPLVPVSLVVNYRLSQQRNGQGVSLALLVACVAFMVPVLTLPLSLPQVAGSLAAANILCLLNCLLASAGSEWYYKKKLD